MAISVDPGAVAGYAWPQSVVPGGSFDLHLSSRTERVVEVEVARVGLQREVVWSATVTVGDHPYPEDFTSAGCGWPVAVSVQARGEWRSGYYEVAFTARGETLGRAFVVVRSRSGAERAILLALATNTWNAYNDVHSGLSLYTGANVVSFQRPMSPGFLHKPPGFGMRLPALHPPDPLRTAHTGYKFQHDLSDWCGSAGWPNWELPFVQWAEREGYELDYAVNGDLESPDVLAPYRLLLSVGHDEYWSGPMRDTVEAFTERGGNVAFLSGNAAFWQVRLEQEGGHAMAGYKYDFERDPVHGTDRERELTSIWSDRAINRPENSMTGVSFCRGGYSRIGTRVPEGSGGYTVHRKDHWLLRDTGLQFGDLLGAASVAVGYECDGCDLTYRDGLPYPTGSDGTPTDFEIVATSPVSPFDRASVTRPIPDDQPSELEFVAWRVHGDMSPETQERVRHGHCVMGTFRREAGTVVTVGSIEWVNALDDQRVARVTRNIIDRLSAIA